MLKFQCECGQVTGDITAHAGSYRRVRCYCSSCQEFAVMFSKQGSILDAGGGSDLCQVSPAQLHFERGLDRLKCLRLSPKGPLRWYADCCSMPIANTASTHQIPFTGLLTANIQKAAPNLNLDEALGDARGIFAKFPNETGVQVPSHQGIPPGMLAATVFSLLKRRLRGDHRRSPFFDAQSGAPIASPTTPAT